MTVSLLLLSVIFAGVGVYCYLQDFQYMASTFLVFWIPNTLMFLYSWGKLDKWYKVSLVLNVVLVSLLCTLVEFLGIQFDFWTFAELGDNLVGIEVGDIPIEEFSFWYGGALQLCLIYATFKVKFRELGIRRGGVYRYLVGKLSTPKETGQAALRRYVGIASRWVLAVLGGFGIMTLIRYLANKKVYGKEPHRDKKTGVPTYRRGRWFPGWFFTVVPFLAVGLIWFFRTLRRINVVAFVLSYLFNNLMFFVMEYNAVIRGHWIWNEQRIFGLKIGVIPVEEVLLYGMSLLFVVPLFEWVRDLLVDIYGTRAEKTRLEKELRIPQVSLKNIKGELKKQIA